MGEKLTAPILGRAWSAVMGVRLMELSFGRPSRKLKALRFKEDVGAQEEESLTGPILGRVSGAEVGERLTSDKDSEF